ATPPAAARHLQVWDRAHCKGHFGSPADEISGESLYEAHLHFWWDWFNVSCFSFSCRSRHGAAQNGLGRVYDHYAIASIGSDGFYDRRYEYSDGHYGGNTDAYLF